MMHPVSFAPKSSSHAIVKLQDFCAGLTREHVFNEILIMMNPLQDGHTH